MAETGRAEVPTTPSGLAPELARLIDRVAARSASVGRHPRPSAASLHGLHRDLRRLHLGLSMWKSLASATARARLDSLDRRVRRLAQLVGQVRDRDVAVEILQGVEHVARPGPERERLDRYRGRLRDDAHIGRELLRARLRSETDARLFEELRSALDGRPARLSSTGVRRLLNDHQGRLHRKLVAAHRKARRRPSMDRLHRLRIRVRRFRQLIDLAATVDPPAGRPVAGALRRLQQELGHLHDLDVLLAGLEPSLRKSRWAEQLGAERRAVRRSVVDALEMVRPRRLLPSPPDRTG